MRDCVLNTGVIIRMLLIAKQINAIQFALGSFAPVINHQVKSLQGTAQCQVEAIHHAVAAQLHVNAAYVHSVFAFHLQAVMGQPGTFFQNQLADSVGEGKTLTAEVFCQAQLTVGLKQDQQSLVNRKRLIFAGGVPNQLNRLINTLVRGQSQEHPVGQVSVMRLLNR